jgi:hypothetical protein
MSHTNIEITGGDFKYITDSKEEAYKFRLYNAQIKELFEPEGKLIIYLTLILGLGLIASIIYLWLF